MRLAPLHIVRYSSLVISQLRTYLSPRKHHLALLYREARTCAGAIGVVRWGHDYHDYNKMADHVAKIAYEYVIFSSGERPVGPQGYHGDCGLS